MVLVCLLHGLIRCLISVIVVQVVDGLLSQRVSGWLICVVLLISCCQLGLLLLELLVS